MEDFKKWAVRKTFGFPNIFLTFVALVALGGIVSLF